MLWLRRRLRRRFIPDAATARELDEDIDPDAVPFERELIEIAAEPDWETFWLE